jgi:hypothetical protein
MNWYLGYYKDQAKLRFELLLDYGADVILPFRRMARILPIVHCCFTARQWDWRTISRTQMRCYCFTAAPIRIASRLTE